MKKTKVIEVNICDQCGAEVGEHHIKTCASCKKEVCPNCIMHFHVTVQKVTPSKQERSDDKILFNRSIHTRPSYESGFNATYCSVCGNDIDRRLIEAGFIPSKAKASRGRVVMD